MGAIKLLLRMMRYHSNNAGVYEGFARRAKSDYWREYWSREAAEAQGKAVAYEWRALECAAELGLEPF